MSRSLFLYGLLSLGCYDFGHLRQGTLDGSSTPADAPADQASDTQNTCGECVPPLTCGGGPIANACGCTPNSTSCAGDMLLVCNDAGTAVAAAQCPLGCNA